MSKRKIVMNQINTLFKVINDNTRHAVKSSDSLRYFDRVVEDANCIEALNESINSKKIDAIVSKLHQIIEDNYNKTVGQINNQIDHVLPN